jgi:hypothetical protein
MWAVAWSAFAVAGWFHPSFANSFTLCLIGWFVRSFVLPALPWRHRADWQTRHWSSET